MKQYDIALFKEFAIKEGIERIFQSMYFDPKMGRAKQFGGIEEYLKNIEVEKAFFTHSYFIVNHRYGYDFWHKMQDMFMEYREKRKEEDEKEPWYFLHGHSRFLRFNWDSEKPFREESRAKTAERLGIVLPEQVADEYMKEYMKKMQGKVEDAPVKKDAEPVVLDDVKEEDVLSGFTFVDIKPRRKLKDDEISVNRKSGYQITINLFLTREIAKKCEYQYAALMRNKSGDVVIVLNNEDGALVRFRSSDGDVGNASISNKVLVERIAALLDLKSDYEILKVKEIANTSKVIAYQIFKNNKNPEL